MSKEEIKVVVVQPGRITGKYRPIENGLLELEKVIYPEETLPFDFGIIPYTLSEKGEPLQVVLLGDISHPLHTQISARLLGGILSNDEPPCLVAVPLAGEKNSTPSSVTDIDDSLLRTINRKIYPTNGTHNQWLSADDTEVVIKEARLKFRMIKVENYHSDPSQPSWKPIDTQRRTASYTDANGYTDAEYTFFQLPGQIQHYITDYLDNDERILYAVRRPSMRSQLVRSWFGREKLQEGVIILTTQRLIQLVELVPLGDSGVRYGFNASLGVLERFKGMDIELLGDDVIHLRTHWDSRDGSDSLDWETPLYTRSELLGLTSFLEKFLPENINPVTIRRSAITPPSNLPQLVDPADTNPEASIAIHQFFSESIPPLLEPGETIHAWALWPDWFEEKGFARVLVITNTRIVIFPDPKKSKDPLANIPLTTVTTLDYVGSILHSYFGFSSVESGKVIKTQWEFPYTADAAFHNCFEAARHCMASLPLVDC